MTNYSADPSHVRVDFFKPAGKWYTTEQVNMTGFYHGHTVDVVKAAVTQHLKGSRLRGMWAVCLEPYCEAPFPVMFVVSGPIARSDVSP